MRTEMLDPWNVAGVVFAASRLAWDIAVFWRDAPDAPEDVRELLYTVEILQRSAQNVRDGFLARANPDDIETQNYQSIRALNEKCEQDLRRLWDILPKSPGEDASKLDELWIHFKRKMSEDKVRDIISGIKLCNNALQIELQMLCAFQMESGRQHDHTAIQRQWDSVLGQADDILSHRPFREGAPDWDSCLDKFVSSLKDSASTSEGRSMIMHTTKLRRASQQLHSPHALHSPFPPRRDSRQSTLSNAITYREDASSSITNIDDLEDVQEETAIPYIIAQDILARTLQSVEKYLRMGDYAEAARIQKRAMEYRVAGDTPVPTYVICRDEMKLADIYRRIGPKALPLAEDVLVRVIDRLATEDLEQPCLKSALLAELYHDLGRVCLELKRGGMASEHLTEAFNIMVEAPSPPIALLRSVGTMLFRIYTDTNKPEVAEALDEHAEARCGFSVKTLAWCQEKGFETELDIFAFDKCDTREGSTLKGLSPLHLACKTGNDKILHHMLTVPDLHLEVTDNDGATPFLLACTQQDAVVADMLLFRGAKPSAVDKSRRNGLHLCQRDTGGTVVAGRLLSIPGAVDVNAMDACQSSALHLAASMGNMKMVFLLLNKNADPNIQGPGGYTPLMAAAQATMRSQEAKMEVLMALVQSGADATLRYSGGQTAADMANDSSVSKVLKGWAKERQKFKPVKRLTFPWMN